MAGERPGEAKGKHSSFPQPSFDLTLYGCMKATHLRLQFICEL